MTEKEMSAIMKSLESGMLDTDLDALAVDLDIDMDAIMDKAQTKLKEEQRKMKRIKLVPLVAAACLLVGTTVVYAEEISDFIKSFTGKSVLYSTMVDGTAYYLESPLALEGGGQVNAVTFSQDELQLVIDAEYSELSVAIAGKEHLPQGYSHGPNGDELWIYGVTPQPAITLQLDGKQYPITLTKANDAADSQIVPAEANPLDWVNIGYARTDNSVRIFTSFEDQKVALTSIGQPEGRVIEGNFENQENGIGSSHSSPLPLPLKGTGKSGKQYQFATDPNDVGRPLTVFSSNAPLNEEISLEIPAIVVTYATEQHLDISLPAAGETATLNKTLDLGLQSMELKNIRRTSVTTAELTFALNTGSQNTVSIMDANLFSQDLQRGEYLYQDNTCTMTITFAEDLESFSLELFNPYFVVDGNWTLTVQ